MSRRGINRSALCVVVVTCVIALSACWVEAPSSADPGYVLHHSFSLSPGIFPGVVTDCYYINSTVPDRHALCRLVEGAEEAGQPGNWDVKFDGGDHVVAENCKDLFWAGCTIVAPNGMTYEGCYPYYDGATKVYWCDYRTSHWFLLDTTHNSWRYVLHMFWDWGTYVALGPVQCAYGLVGALSLEMTVDNDWLVSCVDGP